MFWTVNEWCKPKTEISKAKMARNDKVSDLLLKDIEEEIPIYTFQLVWIWFLYSRIPRLSAYLDPCRRRDYSCTREPGNEQDCNAVAVMYEDRVVGHIPLAISECISLFLTLPGSFLETKVIGKRINQGGGYGLEVPCKYRPHFYKNTRLLQINV